VSLQNVELVVNNNFSTLGGEEGRTTSKNTNK